MTFLLDYFSITLMRVHHKDNKQLNSKCVTPFIMKSDIQVNLSFWLYHNVFPFLLSTHYHTTLLVTPSVQFILKMKTIWDTWCTKKLNEIN